MSGNDIAEIPVTDIDTIYLSYDEPQREEFWVKIRTQLPWAKRVDGVKGSDAAHKAAADASETERFILIDGDNIPNFDFWDETLILTPENNRAQFRWRARNHINGLYYGNGGLSCWTREFVWNMRTHENSDGREQTKIEFCFDPQYWPMHDCLSTTYPNYSPKQAWRAGFREGVKLCTRSGVVNRNSSEFTRWVWQRNLYVLTMWQTLGRDIENGEYAIAGARMGTHYLMLQNWDYERVQDFAELDSLWEKHSGDDEQISHQIGRDLNNYLKTDIVELDANQSGFFKKYGIPEWKNIGIMAREGRK
jgi:hypothetical protein